MKPVFHARRLAIGALLPLASSAWADTLSPGSSIIGPAGTTAAAEPQLAGTVVRDVITPFSYEGTFTDSGGGPPVTTHGNVTGTVQSRVVLSVDGTYDFYWRISVDNASFLPVLGFNLGNFAPATYNANWRSDGLGSVQPATIQEGSDGSINWSFGVFVPPSHEIGNNEQSYFLLLDTNAHAYTDTGNFSLYSGRDSGGSMQLSWSGASGPYATFAPAVPEPGSAALAAAGLGVLALLRRRKAPLVAGR
jgi:hypothetical protein